VLIIPSSWGSQLDGEITSTPCRITPHPYALSEKDKTFIRSITSTTEAWDALTNLFIGNESIQESKFDEAHNEADNFPCLMVKAPKNSIGVSRLFK
jgi:hypothetical protein